LYLIVRSYYGSSSTVSLAALLAAGGLLIMCQPVVAGPMIESRSTDRMATPNSLASSTTSLPNLPNELEEYASAGTPTASSRDLHVPTIPRSNAILTATTTVPDGTTRPQQPDLIEQKVEELLHSMSLGQKVGQRIISWINDSIVEERTRDLVTDTMIGGVILRASNIESSGQLRLLTADLQALAASNHPPIGLLIGMDQEGGRVARLRLPDIIRVPAAAVWATRYDANYAEALGYVLSRELQYHGANLNLAPVLDLANGSASSVIGDRAMSADPQIVAELGTAYVRGAMRAGMLVTGKHFPGHGLTTIDSHHQLPRLEHDRQGIQSSILPFKAAIEAGLPLIMTAHIFFSQIDPLFPATFSPIIMRDILRGDLGFSGVLISDAMEMRAISDHYNLREIAKHSLNAGVDIILLADHWDPAELHAEMMDLITTGELEEALVDEGVRRVLRLKLRIKLIGQGPDHVPASALIKSLRR
jgi:beta-N-acetylhexosaminidase